MLNNWIGKKNIEIKQMCEAVRRDMVGSHSTIEEGDNSECPKLKKMERT